MQKLKNINNLLNNKQINIKYNKFYVLNRKFDIL